MATKNIVPNADGEGQLGTSSKSWAQGHIDSITGTIATAAQGNITSVGTLTALTLSGNIAIPNDGTIGSAGTADGIKINSSGKIGINSSSTSLVYPLEVHGGNGDAIIFKDTTNSVTTWLGAFGGAAVAGALTAGDDFALYAGNAEKVRITSGGNVGIGTTPTTQFDIKGDNQHNYIRTYFSGNHISGFQFSDFNGGIWYDAAIDDLFVYAGHANSEISFTAGAAERLRISSEGRIKIPRAFNDTSNQPIIYVDSTIDSGVSTYQGSLLLQAGGAGSASYGAGLRLYGHAHASSPGSVEIGLSAASGATFTVDSFGAGGGDDILKVERDNYNTTIAGNLVIGTAGKGIDFSATSDGGASTPSELLDDYEEGTWTPSYVTNGVASTVAYNIRNGFYTKVGNQVTCWGNIQTNATTWNGDYVQLDGQPFAAANTTMPIGFIPYSFGFAGDHPGGIYYATSTRNYLTYRDAADGQTNELLASDMSPNNGVNTIIFSFTFQTTS